VRYQLRASSGSPCNAAVTAAVGSKLMAAMKKQTQAGDKSMVLFSECVTKKVCGGFDRGAPLPLAATAV
jgi:hypothetical protein